MSPRDILAVGARELGIELTDHQLIQFDRFTELLLEWNERVNLTRITDPAEMAVKHYLDSISLLRFISIPSGASLVDVGTGAGLPGIPLKIAVPGLRLTLLDSLRKRLTFLETAVSELGLTDVNTVHARAEDAGRDKAHREQYDFSVSRAVSRLNTLTELCLPFCRVKGRFVAYKGPDADQEVSEAERAIRLLGGKLDAVHKFALPQSDLQRTLVIIGKAKPTPGAYPRKAGTPERTPL